MPLVVNSTKSKKKRDSLAATVATKAMLASKMCNTRLKKEIVVGVLVMFTKILWLDLEVGLASKSKFERHPEAVYLRVCFLNSVYVCLQWSQQPSEIWSNDKASISLSDDPVSMGKFRCRHCHKPITPSCSDRFLLMREMVA